MTLAVAETLDNGKPIRESVNADIALAIDRFRCFAGVIRADEGAIAATDAYHFDEPLGVVDQIIPWDFPIFMAVWKLAPALAAGDAVVLKPAEQTLASTMFLMELLGDLIPDGVVNVVNGYGEEAGAAFSTLEWIAKLAFTGETTAGKIIRKAAAENLIPVTLELGGKPRRGSERRLLHPADGVPGRQLHADLLGGDLRPGALRDHVQGRSRGDRHRQRQVLRARRGRLEP